jgi:uncharacterized membrane protein AbrB (regulator of aidB expression)
VFQVPLQCGRFRVPTKSVGPLAAFEDLYRSGVGKALGLHTIDHRRNSLIIILACCAVVGFVAGFVLRLPAFIALCLLALGVYAVFKAGIEGGWELTYHIVLVGISFQVGYFVAIVTQTLFRGLPRSRRLRTNKESHRERG